MSNNTILDLTNAEPKTNQLLFVGAPRQYRADCQAGQFKVGASKMCGAKMTMEVIAVKLVEDELFGYEYQKWVNIIFVDPQGVVSSVMLKTESMDNFLEVYRESLATQRSLTTVQLEARMSPRSSKASGNKYHAVEFEIVSDGKYAESIAEFRQALPNGIYRIAIGGGSEPQPNGNGKTSLKKEVKRLIDQTKGKTLNGQEVYPGFLKSLNQANTPKAIETLKKDVQSFLDNYDHLSEVVTDDPNGESN